MIRLVIGLWLALFAAQGVNLFALIAPDTCVEWSQSDRSTDACPDACARCICCARGPSVSAPLAYAAVPTATPVVVALPAVLPPFSSPDPRGIFHVPKLASI